MEFTGILAAQVAKMFLLMLVGVVLFWRKKISVQGSKDLGNLLVYVIMPCVVLNAYMTEFSVERLKGLAAAFGLSILALGLSIGIAALCFQKHPIENFAAAFSNAGFMGIPIIQAVFGSEAVFYASAFVALLNFFQWTYGVFVITGDRKQISLKKVVQNPILISMVAGLVLFMLPVKIPTVISGTLSLISGMNAPVAMISVGIYLAQVPLLDMLKDRTAWLCTFVRLMLIPGLTAALFWLLPDMDAQLKIALLIAAAAPVGSNVAVFAQLHDKNYTQAVKSVCLSSVLSIATLPFIAGTAALFI